MWVACIGYSGCPYKMRLIRKCFITQIEAQEREAVRNAQGAATEATHAACAEADAAARAAADASLQVEQSARAAQAAEAEAAHLREVLAAMRASHQAGR